MPQKNYISHYEHLKNKWIDRHEKLQKRLLEKHGSSLGWMEKSKQLAVGSLASVYFLTSPLSYQVAAANSPVIESPKDAFPAHLDKSVFLINDLQNVLPGEVRALTHDEEEKVTDVLTRSYGFKLAAEMDGKRLNRNYGLIGAEQHLARYPGDTMVSHFDTDEEADLYWSSGMAPGLGAWRYFAPSKDEMTEKDKLREKYYIAVPTFLSPGFYSNTKEYVDFFKYKKMLVVNSQNGRAIVTVIGDAGPAVWTGKHLGGSPEVMKHLQRADGRQRGPVLYFFIDDPEDKIPLGPVVL